MVLLLRLLCLPSRPERAAFAFGPVHSGLLASHHAPINKHKPDILTRFKPQLSCIVWERRNRLTDPGVSYIASNSNASIMPLNPLAPPPRSAALLQISSSALFVKRISTPE